MGSPDASLGAAMEGSMWFTGETPLMLTLGIARSGNVLAIAAATTLG